MSRHSHSGRRLKYTLEMTDMVTSFVGVNTLLPNRLVRESIEDNTIPELSGYSLIRSEVPYGKGSRIDLLLENGHERCFVEIKNCTLVEDQVAYFPDAISTRGLKHLFELEKQVKAGSRCVMFYLIQRSDARVFKPADHIDINYGRALRSVNTAGVEIIVYDVQIDPVMVELRRPVPFEL